MLLEQSVAKDVAEIARQLRNLNSGKVTDINQLKVLLTIELFLLSVFFSNFFYI